MLTRVIPGSVSGFSARAAMIYLPPVLRTEPHAHLPVLELLHGEPGAPSDWITHGRLLATMNAFAAAHHGDAPIVVLPDINGALHNDTECVATSTGDVEGYLTTDVRSYVRSHFPTAAGRWSIAGPSEGGTCAIMLALRHPGMFGVFGDLSGLTRPTLGPRDDRTRTLRELFHGSFTRFDEHDPSWLLRHHRYPTLTGFFACGSDDTSAGAAQARLVAAARAAGVSLTHRTYVGGHTWRVWRAALPALLPTIRAAADRH